MLLQLLIVYPHGGIFEEVYHFREVALFIAVGNALDNVWHHKWSLVDVLQIANELNLIIQQIKHSRQ